MVERVVLLLATGRSGMVDRVVLLLVTLGARIEDVAGNFSVTLRRTGSTLGGSATRLPLPCSTTTASNFLLNASNGTPPSPFHPLSPPGFRPLSFALATLFCFFRLAASFCAVAAWGCNLANGTSSSSLLELSPDPPSYHASILFSSRLPVPELALDPPVRRDGRPK